MLLLTSRSVKREAGRVGVRAAVAGIETKIGRAAIGRDVCVVSQILYRNVLPTLGVGTIPQV